MTNSVSISIHFCLFHNHLNVFVYRLGIERNAAWAMIRQKLDAFLETRMHLENTPRLKAWLYSERISMKAFMVMKFGEQARTVCCLLPLFQSTSD